VYEKMTTGATLGEALQRAMDDPVVRERSFTTPLALAHLRRGRAEEGEGSGAPLSKKTETSTEPGGQERDGRSAGQQDRGKGRQGERKRKKG